jgi:hypothetical protein
MLKGTTLKIKAIDGTIAKYVVYNEVITTTIIDGKVKYTERRDIRRLGFKNESEYIDYLVSQGYKIES